MRPDTSHQKLDRYLTILTTRMHSSRMRTGRSLTVCRSLLLGGGGSFWGGLLLGGLLLRGPPSGGSPWGSLLLGKVSFGGPPSWVGGCLLPGGLLPGGLLLGGGASFWGVPPSLGGASFFWGVPHWGVSLGGCLL